MNFDRKKFLIIIEYVVKFFIICYHVMKRILSKWVSMLSFPVLVWMFILWFFNVVNGNISIRVPTKEILQRPKLHSLYFWKNEIVDSHIKLNEGKLDILNWLIMWNNNEWSAWAQFVTIGWWSDNMVDVVQQSGIWWWKDNMVFTSFSAIGWWSGNTVAWGSLNTIAWWSKNQAIDWWTVVGGDDNVASGTWIIIWWQHNRLNGDGGMVLWSNSQWWNRSFSWNSSIVQWFSAIIMARSWVLVWTTNPITGVNLVVNGAMQIWTTTTNWNAWEIRMQSGCFYGYDGEKWYVLNKKPWDNCPSVMCVFGSISLRAGDSVTAYMQPYSTNCSQVQTEIYCNDDGTIWDGVHQYYPYCYNMDSYGILYKGAVCGSANGLAYTSAPSVWLCEHGNSSNMTTLNNKYTWKCTSWSSVVNCNAVRLYSCGTAPSWNGVVKWATTRTYGYTPTSWTYTNNNIGTPWACYRTCRAWYVRNGNTNTCKVW